MASLASSLSSLCIQHQQQQATFARLPAISNTHLCISLRTCCNLSIANPVEDIQRSQQTAKTWQQRRLVEQLALEETRGTPSQNPTDPAARAVSISLRDVQQVSDVESFLCDLHFDLHVYSTVMQKFGHWKKLDAAFCLFQWLQTRPCPQERPNLYIYSSFLGAMKTSSNFKYFSVIIDAMKADGIESNLITCNTIIECYEQQGLHVEAMRMFSELTDMKVVPDSSTFKALLSGCKRSMDIRKALGMYDEASSVLQNAGMDVATDELREMVSAFCAHVITVELLAGKDPDYVIALFQMVGESMLDMSAAHYDKILWDCGTRDKDYVVAKHVLALRKKCNLPLDVKLCNHIMRFMGKSKKWWAALEVFENMVEFGPTPDSESVAIIRSQFNFLLNASKKRGTSAWSVQLLEKMEAHGILPDRYAWDTTLVACAMRVDPDSAVHVFQKMIDKGHRPTLLSYGALLTTLEKGRLYDKAEQVWYHMKRLGIKPNIRTYTIMISVYGGAQMYDKLKKLLDELYATDLRFTLITYNTLITLCAKVGDAEGAIDWMQQLKQDGFKPDSTSYSQLIIALSLGGQEQLARNAYVEAKQLNVTISEAAKKSMAMLQNIESG